MFKMNFRDFNNAGALLQSAIAADPNYGSAYVYAALWHIYSVAPDIAELLLTRTWSDWIERADLLA
jgi:hypothetical protein